MSVDNVTSRDMAILALLPPNTEGPKAGKTLQELEIETGLNYYTLRNIMADLKDRDLVTEAAFKEGRKVRWQRMGGVHIPSLGGFSFEEMFKASFEAKAFSNAGRVDPLYSTGKAVASLYEVAYMQAFHLDAKEIMQAKQAIRAMLVTDAKFFKERIERIEEMLNHPSLWGDNLHEMLFDATDSTINKDLAHEMFNLWIDGYNQWLSQQKPFNPAKSSTN